MASLQVIEASGIKINPTSSLGNFDKFLYVRPCSFSKLYKYSIFAVGLKYLIIAVSNEELVYPSASESHLITIFLPLILSSSTHS